MSPNASGETVVLSTAANYQVQHLHVVDGIGEDAVVEHAGHSEALLHSPQGRLILASYQDEHIRSAVHRLNADEVDPERRVRMPEIMEEMLQLRMQGWIIQPEVTGRRHGCGWRVVATAQGHGTSGAERGCCSQSH